MNTVPSLRDLSRYITPSYSTEWKSIGIELGLSNAKLKEIKADYHNVKECCNEMLAEWLCVDTEASWEKLLTALESPAVTSGNPVADNNNVLINAKLNH